MWPVQPPIWRTVNRHGLNRQYILADVATEFWSLSDFGRCSTATLFMDIYEFFDADILPARYPCIRTPYANCVSQRVSASTAVADTHKGW
jgi:hypothetical protein